MGNKDSAAGLRGQSAGETAVCTVGAEGNSLRYRGFDVVDLADQSTFYETAHMILKGHLPTGDELDAWTAKLKGLRGLPQPLREVLERIPADAHPMDVMRTGCSMLGVLEPELNFERQHEVVDRLRLGRFPLRYLAEERLEFLRSVGHLLPAHAASSPGQDGSCNS